MGIGYSGSDYIYYLVFVFRHEASQFQPCDGYGERIRSWRHMCRGYIYGWCSDRLLEKLMAENPDRRSGAGKIPSHYDLRFVLREVRNKDDELRELRILQRYEWSQTDGRYGWYDVPLMDEEEDEVR